MNSKMEIERKWLIKEMPKDIGLAICSYTKNTVYLYSGEDMDIRISACPHDSDNKVLTIKTGTGLSRYEREQVIEPHALSGGGFKMINTHPIFTECYEYNLNGYICVVKCVDMNTTEYTSNIKVNPFIYAEIEFSSEEDAKKFKLPDFLDWEEVTYDENYKMKNYWNRTRC